MKFYYSSSEVKASGKPYMGTSKSHNGYEALSKEWLLNPDECYCVDLFVKPDEEPMAYRYVKNATRGKKYEPLYKRTGEFNWIREEADYLFNISDLKFAVLLTNEQIAACKPFGYIRMEESYAKFWALYDVREFPEYKAYRYKKMLNI